MGRTPCASSLIYPAYTHPKMCLQPSGYIFKLQSLRYRNSSYTGERIISFNIQGQNNILLVRLNDVNQNHVRHGLVSQVIDYPWCSASRFLQTSQPAFHKTVTSFKIDSLRAVSTFWDGYRQGKLSLMRMGRPDLNEIVNILTHKFKNREDREASEENAKRASSSRFLRCLRELRGFQTCG